MGAGPNYVLDKGFEASEATTQYYLVKLGAAGKVDLNDTANEACLGVAQEAASASDVTGGKIVDVRIMGVSTAVAAASVSIGDHLKAAGSGKVTPTTGAVKQSVVGIALTAASADGDQIDVLLTPFAQFDGT